MIEKLPGQTTITSSARLAQSLHRQFVTEQQRSGKMVWETPDILPFDGWLTRCWQRAEELGIAPARRLLNDAEERLLWQRLVRREVPELLTIVQTAQMARQAWQLLGQWQLTPADLTGTVSRDVQAFSRWSTLFAAQLAEHEWLDLVGWAQQLADPQTLTQLAQADQIPGSHGSPWRIGFAGFDRFTPVQQALQTALELAGCEVDIPGWASALVSHGAELNHRVTANDDEELYGVAQWARNMLENDPNQRLAVVWPQLHQQRRQVEAVFTQVFQPRQLVGLENTPVGPVAIAIGETLADYRLVADGLKLITLLDWNFPLEAATGVLLSPFVGDSGQRNQRARLDLRLRDLGKAQLKLSDLLSLLGSGRHGGIRQVELPALALALNDSFERLKELPRQARPSHWAGLFAAQLKGFGWPGSEPFDSVLQQTFVAWQELVSDFSALDTVAGDCTLAQARRLLEQLAQQRRFQPLNRGAAVQVLFTLEPWPDQFDAVWVAGLDDAQFPASTAANPFLPLPLQRRLQMPGSSPEWRLQAAQQQLASWNISANRVYLSYAQSGKEGERTPSQLTDWSNVQTLPAEWLAGQPNLVASRVFEQAENVPALVDEYQDVIGLPLPTQTVAKGGAGLFQEQAECPFKAYIRRRLGSEEPPEPEPGLDNLQRGNLMHHALEQFWRAVGGSEQLLAMSDEQLQQQVRQSVAVAIEAAVGQFSALASDNEQLLESERLENLLSRWLREELKREPFTVEAFEKELELQVGQIKISGRVDRVDRLADGRPVIIDYKSGEARRKDWLEERLLSPQLPLYQTQFDDAAGVAVAQLKPKSMKFVEAGEGGLVPNQRGAKDDPRWPDLRDQWWQQLELLAAEYSAGEAQIAPARPAVCNYCELKLVCRIDANREAIDDESPAELGASSRGGLS